MSNNTFKYFFATIPVKLKNRDETVVRLVKAVYNEEGELINVAPPSFSSVEDMQSVIETVKDTTPTDEFQEQGVFGFVEYRGNESFTWFKNGTIQAKNIQYQQEHNPMDMEETIEGINKLTEILSSLGDFGDILSKE